MICWRCVEDESMQYKTQVLETREYTDPEINENYIYRRRRCLNCGREFRTIERRIGEEA
jgi:transcriptional regulator NrdR family protein